MRNMFLIEKFVIQQDHALVGFVKCPRREEAEDEVCLCAILICWECGINSNE